MPEGALVTSFLEDTQNHQSTLSEVFQIKLNNGYKKDVIFNEDVLIKSLYTDSSFYSAVGQEFCSIFNIFYAKSGPEAVAESFHRGSISKRLQADRAQVYS